MSLSDELERLSKLHSAGSMSAEEFARAKGLLLSGGGSGNYWARSVRRQSARKIMGLPLWDIALGPNLERGEMRGHARGFFALGDMATGVFACGGLARGVFALGGLAVGVFAVGGGAAGVLLAIGGGALGGIALGGGAVGLIAVGGGACGYYALGGGAAGAHSLSPLHQDPAAVEFFRHFLPWLRR